MKIFLFAIIAIAISLFLVFYTQYYIMIVTDELISILKDVPKRLNENQKASEEQLECLSNAIDFWKKQRFKLCMIVNRADFEEIEELLSFLHSSAEVNDQGIYAANYDSLKEKLTRMRKSEAFSLEVIL